MKFVPTFPMRVLTTIALVACTTLAYAGPGLPAPAGGSIRFAPASSQTQIAGPGLPAPAGGSIRFAPASSLS
jgi:hypothetical protein